MKVLLASQHFFPTTTGGTEQYVYGLACALKKVGIEVAVLTTINNCRQYLYKEIYVYSIDHPFNLNSEQQAGLAPSPNIIQFEEVLDTFKPDIFHLHSFNPILNHFHLQLADNKGIKTFFTAHMPGLTCLRGDLLYMGKENCDGKINTQKCLSCFLQFRQYPMAPVITKLASLLSLFPGYTWPSTRWHASKIKSKLLNELQDCCHTIITVSNWQLEVLQKNGIHSNKLALCRIGINPDLHEQNLVKKWHPNLVIGFIGRITPVKGLHILLAALKKLKTDQVTLIIAGSVDYTDDTYFQTLKTEFSAQTNIKWLGSLATEKIDAFLDSMDVLCVPSLGYETGPYVVYEAMARKTPVIGSRLGGIAELIKPESNGILFNPGDATDLAAIITRLVNSPSLVKELSDNITKPRTFEDMGHEMMAIYQVQNSNNLPKKHSINHQNE